MKEAHCIETLWTSIRCLLLNFIHLPQPCQSCCDPLPLPPSWSSSIDFLRGFWEMHYCLQWTIWSYPSPVTLKESNFLNLFQFDSIKKRLMEDMAYKRRQYQRLVTEEMGIHQCCIPRLLLHRRLHLFLYLFCLFLILRFFVCHHWVPVLDDTRGIWRINITSFDHNIGP